jgi:hypothetical protein
MYNHISWVDDAMVRATRREVDLYPSMCMRTQRKLVFVQFLVLGFTCSLGAMTGRVRKLAFFITNLRVGSANGLLKYVPTMRFY